MASSLDDRDEIRRSLETQIKQLLPQVRTRVSLLENGPPVGYPLQYRVSGEDLNLVRKEAQQVARVISETRIPPMCIWIGASQVRLFPFKLIKTVRDKWVCPVSI